MRGVWLLLACLLGYVGPALAKDDFVHPDLQLRVQQGEQAAWVLNGNLGYRFSKTAQEALDNGMPLVIHTEIQLEDGSAWFWQAPLVEMHYTQHIQYHALSQQYLVRGMQQVYPQARLTLDSAIEALGAVHNLQLAIVDDMGADKDYRIRVRSRLDIESLPSPLRPLAYVSPEWRLESGWLDSALRSGPFGETH